MLRALPLQPGTEKDHPASDVANTFLEVVYSTAQLCQSCMGTRLALPTDLNLRGNLNSRRFYTAIRSKFKSRTDKVNNLR